MTSQSSKRSTPLYIGALAQHLIEEQARKSPEKIAKTMESIALVKWGSKSAFHIDYDGIPYDSGIQADPYEDGILLMGEINPLESLTVYDNSIDIGEDFPELLRQKALAGYYCNKPLSDIIGSDIDGYDPIIADKVETMRILGEDLIILPMTPKLRPWKEVQKNILALAKRSQIQ